MTIGFIGLGNIGTTLANLIANNGYDVLGWEYHEQVVNQVNKEHKNDRFLSGITLSENLRATKKVQEVLYRSDIIFNAIHSSHIYETLEKYRHKLKPGTLIINLSKGLDNKGRTACQILEELFPNNKVLMLTGPTIANEVARRNPTLVIIAGASIKELTRIANIMDNSYFRVRFSEDRIGLELGGILKNIYAIGLGILAGENIKSVNFKAVYLTHALEEMTKIGLSLGAKAETFLSVAGVGDLLATSISESSHNRRLGILLAKGLTIDQIKTTMGVLPEGYNTLKNTLYLSEKLHVSIPLAQSLWKVIKGELSSQDFVSLITRNFNEL